MEKAFKSRSQGVLKSLSHLIDHLQRVSAAGAASPGQSGVRGEYSAQTDETRSAEKFNLVNQIPDVEL